MSFLGGTRTRDSWVQRAANPNGFRSSSIANTSQQQFTERQQPPSQRQEDKDSKESYNMAFQRTTKTDVNSIKKSQNTAEIAPNVAQSQDDKYGPPVVPKYIETDKQVLRFLCHIIEMDRGSKVATPINIRFFTLLIYLENNTFEIIEDKIPNSGIGGGTFYRRNVLNKRDGSAYRPTDLNIGITLSAIGQEFHITDCDEFTRDFYKKSLGIYLNSTIPRPSVPQSTKQSSANRNQSTIFATSTTLPTQSVPVAEAKSKDISRKPVKNYLNADPRILRFNIVEVEPKNISVTITASLTPSTYGLLFYLADETIEVRLLSKTSHDEATVLIKRQQIPKNYVELDSFNRGNEIFFEPTDFICGKALDIYGRKFLILTCDAPTRLYYKEIGIEQPEIVVEAPGRTSTKESTGVVESSLAGLQIGERERNPIIHPNPEFKGIILRCKCCLLSGEGETRVADSKTQRPQSAQNFRRRSNTSHTFRQQDNPVSQPKSGLWFQSDSHSRLLLLTYYFEDFTLAINEEDAQNSLHSGSGKSFLRRNRYPKDGSNAYFDANDLYLGNTITINGFSMKIVEMDESSCKYCEEKSDSINFIYFNIDLVVDRLLDKVVTLGLNTRDYLKQFDQEEKGWIPVDEFISSLERDPINISSFLNEQEISTLKRAFSATNSTTTSSTSSSNTQTRSTTGQISNLNESKIFYYPELCDLLSKRYYLYNVRSGEEDYPRQRTTQPWGNSNERSKTSTNLLPRYFTELRSRSLLWRSVFRQSNERVGFYLRMADLVDLMEENGCRFSPTIIGEIISQFSLPQQEANAILQVRDQLRGRRSEDQNLKSSTRSNEYDLERIIIDYQRFCDGIYPLEWRITNGNTKTKIINTTPTTTPPISGRQNNTNTSRTSSISRR